MRLIGLVGGVASGKSAVAEQFGRLGGGVIDADKIGHAVLRLPEIEAAARQRWGEEVFGPDGRIDRTRLARVVFAPGPEAAEQRRYLEQQTHPVIGRQIEQQTKELAAAGVEVVVLDAAVLFEAGWEGRCEKIVFVDCPRDVRMARALSRGWSREDFAAREAAQESLEHKRARADVIIDNSGPLQRTQAQIERFWASLVR